MDLLQPQGNPPDPRKRAGVRAGVILAFGAVAGAIACSAGAIFGGWTAIAVGWLAWSTISLLLAVFEVVPPQRAHQAHRAIRRAPVLSWAFALISWLGTGPALASFGVLFEPGQALAVGTACGALLAASWDNTEKWMLETWGSR